jgi:hypothetical protein
VGILSRGDLKAVGKVTELLGHRIQSYEVAFSGLPSDALPGIDSVVSRDGEQTLVRVRDEAAVRALVEAVLQSGGTLQAVIPQRERLEDLFLREVRK